MRVVTYSSGLSINGCNPKLKIASIQYLILTFKLRFKIFILKSQMMNTSLLIVRLLKYSKYNL